MGVENALSFQARADMPRFLARGCSQEFWCLARMRGGGADGARKANGGRNEEAIRNIFKLHHPHPPESRLPS